MKRDPSDALTVRLAKVGDLTASDFARWRRLEQRAAEPYPYLSADYLEPADPHWPEALAVRLLLVETEDELLLVMPYRVDVLHPRLPVRVLSTFETVLGDEGVRSYPLVDRDRAEEVLRTAFASLRSLGLPTLVDVAAIPADGRLYGLLVSALTDPHRCLVRGRSMLAVTRFPVASGTDMIGGLDVVPHHRSASTRKQARQRLKALERAVGASVTALDRSHDPAVLDDFLDLQAAGWKGDASRHGLAYRLTGRGEWFRESARRFQAESRFAALELRAGDQPLYIAVGVASGRTFFGWQDAYAEAAAPYSIGALGRTAFANWLATRGHDMFDPNMSWSYVEAARIFPDHREQLKLLVAAEGVWSLAVVRLLSAGLHLRERVRTARDRRRRPPG